MSLLLFIENSQPFPKILLSVLIKEGKFPAERAFSPVNAVNKMKDRAYHLVLMCGRETGKKTVQDAAWDAGVSFLSVDLSPTRPAKNASSLLSRSPFSDLP